MSEERIENPNRKIHQADRGESRCCSENNMSEGQCLDKGSMNTSLFTSLINLLEFALRVKSAAF